MSLFQLGFGFVSVLVLGVLNRVMFAEIGLAATLIGLLLAIPSLMSPLRLWIGYLSDTRPIRGYRRFPYILAGTVLAAVGVFFGTLGALWTSRNFLWGVLVAAVSFAAYGIGKSTMATAFQALIADVFDAQWRPKASAALKAVFVLGIIGASVVLGGLLDAYSTTRLVLVVAGTGLVAILLSVLGCVALEPTGQDVETLAHHARQMPLAQTLAQTVRDPQARRFFFFVGFTLLATLSQDIFLEPYGAKVFGMPVGQTARLNMYWGAGTMGALLICGLYLVNRFGRKRMAGIGLGIVAVAFAGLIVAGAIGHERLFTALVFALGVGSGISASGALTLMVDFTTPERAGLLMGAWTIAHQLAEVLGNVMGGVLVDTVLAVRGDYLMAFGTVFGLEILAALAGLSLLPRINAASFLEGCVSTVQPVLGGDPLYAQRE
jgi:BCD family chlorophyll transporter-like MFS transporter